MSPLLPTHSVGLPHYAETGEAETADLFRPIIIGTGAAQTMRAPQSGYIEYLTAMRAKASTSAAVANRQYRANLVDDRGNVVQSVLAPFVQPASQSVDYFWGSQVSTAWGVAASFANMPVFSLPIIPGWSVVVTADNLQAADGWGSLYTNVTQYPTGSQRQYDAEFAAAYNPPLPVEV